VIRLLSQWFGRSRKRHLARRACLTLERLEDRCLLSAVDVAYSAKVAFVYDEGHISGGLVHVGDQASVHLVYPSDAPLAPPGGGQSPTSAFYDSVTPSGMGLSFTAGSFTAVSSTDAVARANYVIGVSDASPNEFSYFESHPKIAGTQTTWGALPLSFRAFDIPSVFDGGYGIDGFGLELFGGSSLSSTALPTASQLDLAHWSKGTFYITVSTDLGQEFTLVANLGRPG